MKLLIIFTIISLNLLAMDKSPIPKEYQRILDELDAEVDFYLELQQKYSLATFQDAPHIWTLCKKQERDVETSLEKCELILPCWIRKKYQKKFEGFRIGLVYMKNGEQLKHSKAVATRALVKAYQQSSTIFEMAAADFEPQRISLSLEDEERFATIFLNTQRLSKTELSTCLKNIKLDDTTKKSIQCALSSQPLHDISIYFDNILKWGDREKVRRYLHSHPTAAQSVNEQGLSPALIAATYNKNDMYDVIFENQVPKEQTRISLDELVGYIFYDPSNKEQRKLLQDCFENEHSGTLERVYFITSKYCSFLYWFTVKSPELPAPSIKNGVLAYLFQKKIHEYKFHPASKQFLHEITAENYKEFYKKYDEYHEALKDKLAVTLGKNRGLPLPLLSIIHDYLKGEFPNSTSH